MHRIPELIVISSYFANSQHFQLGYPPDEVFKNFNDAYKSRTIHNNNINLIINENLIFNHEKSKQYLFDYLNETMKISRKIIQNKTEICMPHDACRLKSRKSKNSGISEICPKNVETTPCHDFAVDNTYGTYRIYFECLEVKPGFEKFEILARSNKNHDIAPILDMGNNEVFVLDIFSDSFDKSTEELLMGKIVALDSVIDDECWWYSAGALFFETSANLLISHSIAPILYVRIIIAMAVLGPLFLILTVVFGMEIKNT